jgi:hypothetical protein
MQLLEQAKSVLLDKSRRKEYDNKTEEESKWWELKK